MTAPSCGYSSGTRSAGSRAESTGRDIAGQDRFGVMTHVYYKESRAAVVVFDLTSARSFEVRPSAGLAFP